MDSNIRAVIDKLHNGDVKAFEQLYALFSERIYGRLLRLVGSEEVAGELLQNVFVKLWEHRERMDRDGYVRSWLYKVAENEVYEFYRRAARDRRLQEAVALGFVEEYVHVEEAVLDKERRELLERAVEQLSPQRREVFTLCKLEGKSYQEAAELLGISSSTVSNTLVKANSNVRDYLFKSKDSLILLAVGLLGFLFDTICKP